MEFTKDPMGLDLSPNEGMDRPVCPCHSTHEDVVVHPDNGAVCGCGHQGGWGLNGHPLAMVYAPGQVFRGLYDLDTALSRGTLFSELDLPLEVGYAQGGCGCGHREERRGRSC